MISRLLLVNFGIFLAAMTTLFVSMPTAFKPSTLLNLMTTEIAALASIFMLTYILWQQIEAMRLEHRMYCQSEQSCSARSEFQANLVEIDILMWISLIATIMICASPVYSWFNDGRGTDGLRYAAIVAWGALAYAISQTGYRRTHRQDVAIQGS